MKTVQNIAFDFSAHGITPRIYGKQGDAGSRMVTISLYDQGSPWPVPDGALLALRFKTPSGVSGLYDTIDGNTAFAVSENVVTVELATPIFVEAGATSCELTITDSEGGISTWTFLVAIEAGSISSTEVPEDYYNAFLGMVADVKADADRAEEAADSIDTTLLMSKTMYDPAGAVEAAGGIPKYVAANAPQGNYIPTSQKGAASGVATLNESGKVPSTQLNMSDSATSTSSDTVASSKAVKTVNDKIPTLSSSTSSTSTTTAANSAAVKTAYDRANEAYSKANSAAVVTTLTPVPTMIAGTSASTINISQAIQIGNVVFIVGEAVVKDGQLEYVIDGVPTPDTATDFLYRTTNTKDETSLLAVSKSSGKLHLTFAPSTLNATHYFQFFYWV